MLVRDGAALVQADPQLTTGPAPLGHHLADFHRAMIDRAREALDLFPREEREIGSVTLCIDEAMLPALLQRLRSFRRELMRFEESGDRKRVVQVNFQLFPLSKKETPK
jgi:uncharacterized protein (TIGR02147 family)